MNIETIKSVYFVGAGGIGMSALVRYFLFKGKVVAGYDRTPTPLTETLISEGAQIHYEENVDLIPEACKDKESTLVIYTPAVPQEHEELVYFRNNGFEIQKRAQVLGTITHSSKGLCVAGTHGICARPVGLPLRQYTDHQPNRLMDARHIGTHTDRILLSVYPSYRIYCL